MKRRMICFVGMSCVAALAACGPSPGQLTATASVALAQTLPAVPAITSTVALSPIPTNTPIPTGIPTPTAILPPVLQGLEDLVMAEDSPGSGFWVVALAGNRHRLLEIVPDAWQGNANLYPYDGTVRVGHLWSQFLMLSPGQWLTDRVESEGQRLLSFEVVERQGRIIQYRGEWAFRDLFTSAAEHHIWVRGKTVFHYVQTDLTVLKEIPNVGAVWVELMNDADTYGTIAVKTQTQIIERKATGTTDQHYLDENTLDEAGWITIYGPRGGQQGSAALVVMNASDPVHPRSYDGHVDNIELHMLDPRQVRTLPAGQSFHLDYLVLVSSQADTWDWIDEAIEEARVVLEWLGETAR